MAIDKPSQNEREIGAGSAADLGQVELFCRRGDTLGFQAWGPAGAGWVGMYRSLAALAAAEGACGWFSGLGRQLMALVPPGYGVVLDPGSEDQVVLAYPAVLGDLGPAALARRCGKGGGSGAG